MSRAIQAAQDRELLTISEAAAFLGIHPNTLKRWCVRAERGETLPVPAHYRMGPRQDYRFSRGALEAFLEDAAR